MFSQKSVCCGAGHERGCEGMNARTLYASLMPVIWKALYWAAVLAVSVFVFIHFCTTSGVGGHGPAKVERVLTGTADRPYVFRVLLPLVANALAPLLDERTALYIGIESERVLGERFFQARLNGAVYPRQAILILFMMYLSLVGFAIAMWFLVGSLGYAPRVQYASPHILLLGSMIFMQFGYIYDLTALFLFSLGLLLLLRQQWVAYIVVFVCTTLNKETSIFLVLIFALYYSRRLPRRSLIVLSAVQLAGYGLIQGIIRYVFRNNPGQALQWHWEDQVSTLRQLAVNSPLQLLYGSAVLVILAMLVAYGWRSKPVFLRTAILILPFFVVLFFLWGYPLEIRAMFEVYPVVAILLLPPQLLDHTRTIASTSENVDATSG